MEYINELNSAILAMRLSILENIIWFDSEEKTNLSFSEEKRFIPLKKFNKNNKSTTGILFSRKCNKEIRYESQIELETFSAFEMSDEIIDYGSQPLVIKYDFNKKSYTPDFYIKFKNGRVAIGEVKPIKEMGYFLNWIKWRAMKEFCKEHGLGMLITDGKTTFLQIRKGNLKNIAFYNNLKERLLRQGALEWSEVYELKQLHKSSMNDLAVSVIKGGFYWHQDPFKLLLVNKSGDRNY